MNTVSSYTKEIKEATIHDALLDIGMKPSLTGYRYIVYAIQLIAGQPIYLRAMSKGLYVDVAEHFDTTPACVERAIRNAIGSTWQFGNMICIHKIFKNSIDPEKGVPTNTMFLTRLYHYCNCIELE